MIAAFTYSRISQVELDQMSRRTHHRKEQSTGRVEAISDGVFSVALTLLVLDIHVPDTDGTKLIGELVKLLPHVLAFVLSFLIVCFYWTAHQVLFNSIHRSDRYLLWLNALHLLFVVLLPFSTAMLAQFHDTTLAVNIYGINIILCSASSIAFWLYAAHQGLVASNLTQREITLVAWRLSINPVVCGFALGVAFLNTTVAILFYLVTPIWYVFTGPDAAAGDPGTWRWPKPWRRRRISLSHHRHHSS
jgi:uncharacterized membrane protein